MNKENTTTYSSVPHNPPVWGVWRSCWTWLCGLLPSGPARCDCPVLFHSDCWQSCSGSWRWWTCWGWTDYCRHYSPFQFALHPSPAPGERAERVTAMERDRVREGQRERRDTEDTDRWTNDFLLFSQHSEMQWKWHMYLGAPNVSKSYFHTLALVRL